MTTITNFVNLTPHAIVFQFDDGSRVEFPSQGLARVDNLNGQQKGILFDGKNMPVNSPITYGDVQGLPEPVEGTYYIVSQIVIVQPSVFGRADVLAPATGPKSGAIRFSDGPHKGQVEAVTHWVAA